MSIMASTPGAMPTSKKRCWTLLVKDIKNLDVKEAEVMSAFRNKYTSARKLAFRSPTKHGDGTSHAVSDIDNDTSPSSVGAGTVLIEIQFTGPQPIEGPAGLLCTLVQGTFVEAHPIQLGRGRKRKIQAGGGPASPGFSFASAPGGSDGISTGTRSFLSSRDSDLVSSGNFDFRLNRNDRSSSGTNGSKGGAAMKAAKNNAAGHDSSGSGTSSTGDETAGDAGTHCHLSSTSSVSSLEHLFGGLLEESTTNDSSAMSSRPVRSAKHLNLSRGSPLGRPQSSDSGGVFPAFRPAYGGEASELESTAASANDTASGGVASDEPGSASHLGRSGSVISVATDDLPEWDDVIRCVDSSSPSCSSTPSSASSSSSPSGERQRWPSINSFGNEDSQVPPTTTGAAAAVATDDNAASSSSLPPSNPSLAAGNSYNECKEGVMSQEEALSLFTTESSPAGGAAVSEDGLWDMPPDGDDSLFCAPPLKRHTSWSWGLVHASGAVVTSDDADDGGDVEIGRDSSCTARPPSAVEQQRQQRLHRRQREDRAFVEDDGVQWLSEGYQVSFDWCEQECDFDGRPAALPRRGAEAPPLTSSSPTPVTLGRQCHFTFQGLQSAIQGYELRNLAVHAQFSVDSVRTSQVEKVARHLEVDARGDVHATVTYPSMLEIWPEVCDMYSIRVVEVDIVVEIRSVDGSLVYTGPTLKVVYRRPATQQVLVSKIPMSRQAARVWPGPGAAGLGPRRVSPGNDSMIEGGANRLSPRICT